LESEISKAYNQNSLSDSKNHLDPRPKPSTEELRIIIDPLPPFKHKIRRRIHFFASDRLRHSEVIAKSFRSLHLYAFRCRWFGERPAISAVEAWKRRCVEAWKRLHHRGDEDAETRRTTSHGARVTASPPRNTPNTRTKTGNSTILVGCVPRTILARRFHPSTLLRFHAAKPLSALDTRSRTRHNGLRFGWPAAAPRGRRGVARGHFEIRDVQIDVPNLLSHQGSIKW